MPDPFPALTLLCAMLGWLIASLLKVPAFYLFHQRWQPRAALRLGFPSALSAAAGAALTTGGITFQFQGVQFSFLLLLASLELVMAFLLRRRRARSALGEIVSGFALGILVALMLWLILVPEI